MLEKDTLQQKNSYTQTKIKFITLILKVHESSNYSRVDTHSQGPLYKIKDIVEWNVFD